MSDPHPGRPPKDDRRTFLQKLAEFIHPGPDSRDELIETLADAEHNEVIGSESRVMLEGVLRMADMTAGDVLVAAPRMDLISIDAPFDELLSIVIETAHITTGYRGPFHGWLTTPGQGYPYLVQSIRATLAKPVPAH